MEIIENLGIINYSEYLGDPKTGACKDQIKNAKLLLENLNKGKLHIACHSVSTMYYALDQKNLIPDGFGLRIFQRMIKRSREKELVNDYPTIDSPEIFRLERAIYLRIQEIKALSLSPIHSNAYVKAQDCTTGKFSLDYLKVYDPDIKQHAQIENNTVLDLSSITNEQLEALIKAGLQSQEEYKKEKEEEDSIE